MKTRTMLAQRAGLTIWAICQITLAGLAQPNVTKVSSGTAWLGFYDDIHLNRIEQITKPSIEEDFELMLSYLTPTEKEKLGEIKLWFPPEYGASPMNFYAATIKGKKTIVLPQSALRFLSDLCLAYAYLNRNKMNEGVISDYLAILRFQWPAIKRKPYRPLDALGIDRAKALANKDVDSLFGKLYSTAIWFIIYHELGHILYHHPGNDIADKAKSRRNETQADSFALTVLRRVGDPVHAGIITFFMISQHFTPFTENDVNYQTQATHPLTGYRLRAVADNLRKNAELYARSQSDPKRFTALYQANADEIRVMGDNLANGKFWKLIQVAGQAGNVEQLNVHRSRPSTVIATDSKDPFVGSFSGYWNNKKQGKMLLQLRLYRQQGQIKGEGLISDPDITRHSPKLPLQITSHDFDNETVYFNWQMGSYDVGNGKLKQTKLGLSGSWEAIQTGGTKQLGDLVLTRTR